MEQAASDGLMTGSQGAFRPEATITEAEVCMTLARREGLDTASNSTVWYAGAMSSAENAGLLDGLDPTRDPETAMTRADTMQVFANVLVRGGAALPDEQQTADTLKT
ncbi:MAG: S-layer homology domain-containing protein [Butyricicoccaceae bacterium]